MGHEARSISLFANVFAVVYAVVYVVSIEHNYALVTYHPVLNQFGLLVEEPKAEVAMYWYGRIATASIAALAAGVIAVFVPKSVAQRLWSGWSWVVPVAVMLVVSYIHHGYFTPRAVEDPSIERPSGAIE